MIIAAVSAGAVCAASRWSSPASAAVDLGVGVGGERIGERRDEDARRQRRVPGAVARLRRRHRHRQVRAPVEAAGEHDHVRPARHLLGELHRGFGDLRTRVRVEERVDARRRDLGQAVGERLEQVVVVAVHLGVDEPLRLLRDRGRHLRVAVAGRRDRDPGGEVEVLDAVGRGDPAPLARRDLQVGDREPHVGEVRRHASRVRATMSHAELGACGALVETRSARDRLHDVRRGGRPQLVRPRPGAAAARARRLPARGSGVGRSEARRARRARRRAHRARTPTSSTPTRRSSCATTGGRTRSTRSSTIPR